MASTETATPTTHASATRPPEQEQGPRGTCVLCAGPWGTRGALQHSPGRGEGTRALMSSPVTSGGPGDPASSREPAAAGRGLASIFSLLEVREVSSSSFLLSPPRDAGSDSAPSSRSWASRPRVPARLSGGPTAASLQTDRGPWGAPWGWDEAAGPGPSPSHAPWVSATPRGAESGAHS